MVGVVVVAVAVVVVFTLKNVPPVSALQENRSKLSSSYSSTWCLPSVAL